MKEDISRDIIENSFYMINLFYNDSNSDKKEITNLKLQKLMYFVEAYYMVKNPGEIELFNSGWSAWNYGPVNVQLYKYYKKFGSMPIVLEDEEIQRGYELPQYNKDCIQEIFNIFSKFSAFELVTLTHLEKSPWSKLYELNKKDKKYDFEHINPSDINKIETKEWFEEEFNFIFNMGNNSR